jgi:hypothetical protein
VPLWLEVRSSMEGAQLGCSNEAEREIVRVLFMSL